MTEALVFDTVRTPRGRGKKSGGLHEVKPVDLLVTLLRALRQRNDFSPEQVEDLILGCVTPIGEQGGNIARTATLYAGWGSAVPGQQINRYCASGLEAINLAAAQVRAGWAGLIIAGGVESMSRNPMGSDGGALFLDPAVNGRLNFIPQGVSADLIATLEGYDRATLDGFAVKSHQRAVQARGQGYFDRSLIPVADINGLPLLDHDETIRDDCSLEGLAGLKPSFAKMGEMGFDATAQRVYPGLRQMRHLHHAGNSSAIVDGAALVLLGNEETGRVLGLQPRARIRSAAVVGSEPTIMLTGPAPATRKALAMAGVTASDIDLFEINEAFAAVVLKAITDLDIDPEKVNVNGGAIAMGHPLGATGAILLGTALDELERREGNLALVTLCVGGGMGVATVLERL